MSAPALELLGIAKSFGSVRALDGASLTLFPGEIHALLGENGAGKTTLVSIAAGALAREAGTIRRNGASVELPDPRAAREAGIALVPQHDLLVPALSAADNLALLDPGAPLLSTPRARRRRLREVERSTGLALGDPDARAEELGVGARQRIGIAGALLSDPEVLVLDEPTAVLAPQEADALFTALRELASRGRAVVLITHRLPEVFAAADRLTLLSRGRTVLEAKVADASAEEVAALLTGGAEEALDTRKQDRPGTGYDEAPPSARESALEVEALVPADASGPPADFRIGSGEGLTLLSIGGNGAEEIAAAIVGTRGRTGKVVLAGVSVRAGDVGAFRAARGAFVPGDRLREGLVPELSVAENLALTSVGGALVLDRAALDRRAADAIARFGIRAGGPRVRAGTLSGGNQQKLLLARELLAEPRLVVAVHPTRGLDLHAAAEVHRRLTEARERGAALLVVTADPDEARVLGVPIRVVYRGALSPELDPETPAALLGRWLSGLAA